MVQAYISRIRDINPLVNSMMDDRFEAALLDAKYVDRVLRMSLKTEQQIATETPFLGVPISIKGSIAVKGRSAVCLINYLTLYNYLYVPAALKISNARCCIYGFCIILTVNNHYTLQQHELYDLCNVKLLTFPLRYELDIPPVQQPM